MFSIIMAKESFLLQGNFFKHKILLQLLQVNLDMFTNQGFSLSGNVLINSTELSHQSLQHDDCKRLSNFYIFII